MLHAEHRRRPTRNIAVHSHDQKSERAANLKGLSMTIRIRSTAALSLAAAFSLCTAPVLAQEAQHNWMREYVQLRKQAMLERVLGVEKAAELRASMAASTKIVGGRPAGAGTHPFQVALLFKSRPDNFLAQYCGGTLIRENVVVTAAHCSDFVTAGEVQVLPGTQDLNGTGTRRNVRRIMIHPNWNPTTFDSDIAIWFLRSDASGIPVAGLTRRDPSVGTNLLATGWGQTESNPAFPIHLRQVQVPLVSTTNCNDANSYNGAITPNMICAGLDAGGKDTCQGDSGGPLTRKKDGTFKLLTGITSFGTGCADPNFFGVYTRVSRFRAWVLNQIS
jgi:secreted trypsin-like serine protease